MNALASAGRSRGRPAFLHISEQVPHFPPSREASEFTGSSHNERQSLDDRGSEHSRGARTSCTSERSLGSLLLRTIRPGQWQQGPSDLLPGNRRKGPDSRTRRVRTRARYLSSPNAPSERAPGAWLLLGLYSLCPCKCRHHCHCTSSLLWRGLRPTHHPRVNFVAGLLLRPRSSTLRRWA